jgi:hypothetical protein
MKTGRFINTLDKNVLAFFSTENYDQLLNKQNLELVWNLNVSMDNFFPDDLAITHTNVTPQFDGSRTIYANDTIIVKFSPDDIPLILECLNKQLNILDKIKAIQGNGVELKNPLPEVKI